jgi:hypothetical protein
MDELPLLCYKAEAVQVKLIGNIVISGSIAQKPWQGGHAWVFLQYLLGFRKLGWDVLFLDQLEPEMCVNSEGRPCPVEESANLLYFLRIMEDFDLKGVYALLYNRGERFIGVSRSEVLERTARSTLLLNIMGFLRDPEILDRSQNRVFLDIDPGFGQMWQELGLHATFTGHHHYVTIGENIGQPECGVVPTCGLDWITTRQPIVLDYWQPNGIAPIRSFTTIASWRGAYGPVPFQGKMYGLRVHEFRKFASLPAFAAQRFELALDIHSEDAADRILLEKGGWVLVDPRMVASSPRKYRNYIQASSAEFMIAKNMYVETQSGWFSDRSICYLASGKPVLAQDTGLKRLYPSGQGLLTFGSMEEAICGVRQISRDYRAHSLAARAIAAEFFDSDRVLSCLLQKLSIN